MNIWTDTPAAAPAPVAAPASVPRDKTSAAPPVAANTPPSPREELLHKSGFRYSRFSEAYLLATSARVLVQQGQYLVALDRATGLECWRTSLVSVDAKEPLSGCPSAGGGYIATPSHSVPYNKAIVEAMEDEIRTYGRACYARR